MPYMPSWPRIVRTGPTGTGASDLLRGGFGYNDRNFTAGVNGMTAQPVLRTASLMYPWPKRTLFMGRLLEPLTVCYGAATLLVSLGRPVTIAVAGRATQGCSFLLPAGMQATINTGSEIMVIFHLDVLGDDFKR